MSQTMYCNSKPSFGSGCPKYALVREQESYVLSRIYGVIGNRHRLVVLYEMSCSRKKRIER